MAHRFEVHGPFEVPVERTNAGHWFLSRTLRQEFWANEECAPLAQRRGCYIFAMRNPRGLMPLYVGKAERLVFFQECFSTDKRNKLLNALARYRRGAPVVFLVCHPRRNLQPPLPETIKTAIREVEQVLIAWGVERNPHLENVHYRSTLPIWSIEGWLYDGRGAPTTPARALKSTLGA